MTAPGDDILAWLNSAISVREAAATAAATAYGPRWVQGLPEQHKDPDMRYGWDQDMVHLSQKDPYVAYQCLSDEIAAHTVLNDPESVLRRCAADRKLLKLYAATVAIQGSTSKELAIMTWAIHNLAEGYGWTGGER